MTIQNINVEATIERVKTLIAEEEGMSPALKASLEVLLFLVPLLVNQLGLNSKNSSKPPSMDPNRKKEPKRQGTRKPGGQQGRIGTTLTPVPDPDEVKLLSVDRSVLPCGRYQEAGYEVRQVIDLNISRVVTAYRAEILKDQQGKRYVAPFPEGVTRPVQYGNGVKVNSVYMSQYQLVPYNRIEDHFLEQLRLPVSGGSIFNFNQEAYDRLEHFDQWVRKQLALSAVLHADETGVNIGGKLHWLHSASNAEWTCFFPHAKRGNEAMDAMGILPTFHGILCHDHWKPYFTYGILHALCNAHHLRELERAFEQDKQQWAAKMSDLLKEINKAVLDASGVLPSAVSKRYRTRYRKVLAEADIECPAPKEAKRQGSRGRIPRSKARNLLERLRDHENDVLRFMDEPDVPFSNNQAENDIRMTKVQQKISGCFRSFEGAQIFCRIRSYLSTCRKQGITATDALTLLFDGKSPEFMSSRPSVETMNVLRAE
ncbi:MAG: IS66 family transposase [Nitrospiraceae bacterium]|nr:IS66 family transposase [Nitrospiraceae bacterium]